MKAKDASMGSGTADTYRTLKGRTRAAFKERGSRFVGEAVPVGGEEEAAEALAAIRRREHAATHHCSAYRLGVEGDRFRYDDDGEPSGTAGPPILRQIDGRDLTDVLVVVTRYYGGTKLGTGGLVRAYGDAAAAALEAGTVVRRVLRTPVRLRFDYDDTTAARQTIEHYAGVVTAEAYGADTRLVVAVRRSEAERFVRAFTDALGARGTARIVEDES